MKKYLVLSAILFFAWAKGNSQTVQTQYGPVTGHMDGAVFEFLGIPYASPPTGNLRWKAPTPHSVWSAPLLADSFPPVCPQKHFEQGQPDSVFTIEGNEDCLYLNVWTPDTAADLPVMVFIHGGGNQQGSTSEVGAGTQLFFGKNMSERGNVVVVTLQYRLGPLGFLVHPGLENENVNHVSGNYAILDQIMALKWVKNNITHFGGDTSKVMIFGQSAGGIDVGDLLLTPLAKGLFQRACIESATPVISDYQEVKNNGIAFVDSFISTGTDSAKINFMRSVPADSLVKGEGSPTSGGTVSLAWTPVLDNYVFSNTPTQGFESGNFNKVPLLIGSNADEMSLDAPQTVYPYMVTALIKATVPDSLQAQAELLYPAGSTTAEARQSYVGILTDGQFTFAARRTAQCVSLNQNEPVWRYFFTYKHSVAALSALGSYHGMELFYVFNNWENATLGSGPFFAPSDDSVQQVMLRYWVNFATTGDPNDGVLEHWPQYDASTDCYMELKATPDGTQSGIRTEECNLWGKVAGFTGCTSSTGPTGIDHTENATSFICYPNPSNGIFYLKGDLENNYTLSVFNALGQKINSVVHSNYIDLTGQYAGVYYILVETKHKVFNGKIIKVE